VNPERWVLRVVLVLLRGYKLLISPWLPPACRFWPTCSEYAQEAVVRHGVRKGVWLGLKRLARCHPWGPHGPDPVP
jgi:putative membrane protein insertion efficiency factor